MLGLGLGLDVFFDTNSIQGSSSVEGVMNSSWYRQTNSSQALKETNRFTWLNGDPCSYARVSRLGLVLGLGVLSYRGNIRGWC